MVMNSSSTAKLQEIGEILQVAPEDTKAIRKARKKVVIRRIVIGIGAIVGSFVAGALIREVQPHQTYPFAATPILLTVTPAKRQYLAIALASVLALVLGFLLMHGHMRSEPPNNSYYSVYRR